MPRCQFHFCVWLLSIKANLSRTALIVWVKLFEFWKSSMNASLFPTFFRCHWFVYMWVLCARALRAHQLRHCLVKRQLIRRTTISLYFKLVPNPLTSTNFVGITTRLRHSDPQLKIVTDQSLEAFSGILFKCWAVKLVGRLPRICLLNYHEIGWRML